MDVGSFFSGWVLWWIFSEEPKKEFSRVAKSGEISFYPLETTFENSIFLLKI